MPHQASLKWLNNSVAAEEGTTDSDSNLVQLLVTPLQLYSDHARNFDLIESECHTLSHYFISFPCLNDISVKVLALKMLDYVCIGLASGTNSAVPLRAATEVFGSSVRHLLRMAGGAAADDSDRPDPEALRAAELDLEMLCDTLVKLLEFDDGVGRVMLECVWPAGLLGPKADGVLGLTVA